MAKSDKLYSKSPKIERDDKGKVGIKKPSKADKEDMGLEDNAGADTKPSEMPIQVHQSYDEVISDMHNRHQSELKDMHKRHFAEMETIKSKLSGDDLINKVEKDEKE